MSKFPLLEQPNVCVHCGKKFMQPRTLFSHMCEQKRRALQRDEKRVLTGMITYNRFYQLTQNPKTPKPLVSEFVIIIKKYEIFLNI